MGSVISGYTTKSRKRFVPAERVAAAKRFTVGETVKVSGRRKEREGTIETIDLEDGVIEVRFNTKQSQKYAADFVEKIS